MEVDSRSSCLMKLFKALKVWDIPYVVVGDTRLLPSTISGDVDIVIASGMFKKFLMLLCHHCEKENSYFIQVLQHESKAWYCVTAWHDESGHLCFLHPDVCHQYMRGGRVYLEANEMLEGRLQLQDISGQRQGFFVPEPSRTFIYYLIKKIEKCQMTREQGEYLSEQWKKNTKGSLQLLKRFWPETHREQLSKMAKCNTWPLEYSHLEKFRHSLWERITPSLKGRVLEFSRKAYRFCNPTGLLIVFLGPDGSGKSAVLARVKDSLAPAFRKTKYYHHRPNWKGLTRQTRSTESPHNSPPRGPFASLAKLGMWWIDYFMGYWFDIYYQLVSSTLVLFDRYYYDVLVDSRRYRYGGSHHLAVLVGKCIPNPDLVILLDAPPEILLQRKQEVPLPEIIRQRAAYTSLVHALPNGVIIDSSRPLDHVVKQVEQVVLKYMAVRLKQRIGANKDKKWK